MVDMDDTKQSQLHISNDIGILVLLALVRILLQVLPTDNMASIKTN